MFNEKIEDGTSLTHSFLLYTLFHNGGKYVYSFVLMLIGPHCLDRICRIQKILWLKARQRGPILKRMGERTLYFPPFWNKGYACRGPKIVRPWSYMQNDVNSLPALNYKQIYNLVKELSLVNKNVFNLKEYKLA